MSTSVIEVTRLEDLVTMDPPPCEMVLVWAGGREEVCGKPSVIRVVRRCGPCGTVGTKFFCQPCYDLLRNGGVTCNGCLDKITDWNVI